ncbi:MAG: PQQ-binding-like beta-propeller repeat protein [Calditrichae bacterium]|nr:PQQ-binding-like beta-propeller repeat protein [Calditrichia bacterium]
MKIILKSAKYINLLMVLLLPSLSGIFSCKPAYLNKIISEETNNQITTAFRDYLRNGFQQVSLPDSLVFVKEEDLRGLPYHSLLSYSGKLMFITHNGYLYFMDHDDFDDIRKSSLADGITAAPSIFENLMFIPVSKGKKGLLAYDLMTGDTKWEASGRFSQSTPVIYDTLVIHASLDGNIAAFGIQSGKKLWENQLGDKIVNSLTLAESNVIVASQNGIIRSYGAISGSLNWSLTLKESVYATPVANSKYVYICTYSGKIVSINIKTGNRHKEINTKNEILLSPVMDNSHLYIAQASGTIASYSIPDLKITWAKTLDGPYSSTPLLTLKDIFLATTSKHFYRLKKETGEIIMNKELEGRVRTQPVVYQNKLYIGYEPDYIAVFSEPGLSDD